MKHGIKSGINTHTPGLKGAIHRWMANRLEFILSIPGGRLYRRHVRACQRVEAEQLRVLREILTWSQDTEVGRQFGFADIRTHADYRQRVPVMDYEQHRPWIERHAQGEENVLFPGRPMVFTRTSGTTAKPKLIPITQFNFNRTIRNRGKLWLHNLSRHFPGIYAGKDFTLVSPAFDGETEGGIPFGSLSGIVYQNIPAFMKLVHTIPYEVLCIPDYDAKAYALLRFGVPSHVTCIQTGNPGTLLNLAQKADLWKDTLIEDIRAGTLSHDFAFTDELRATLEAMLEPAPERADELAAIAQSHPTFRPADYWPDLRLVHTWTNGNCALVIPKLRDWFHDETPILDFGYIASEINASDVIEPGSNGSHLSVRSAFYEFSAFEEDDQPTRFYMAHELEVGRRYFIYVTTYSGLYRYDMNDVVEVVGHFHQAPILKFLFKGKGVTSLQGEKLSEHQLIEAVAQAARDTGIGHDFFTAVADPELPGYTLYIELHGDPTDARTAQFAAAVDNALCQVNIEYAAKRDSERLVPVRVLPLREKAFDAYRIMRLTEGAFEGQLKWLHLSMADDMALRRMEGILHPSVIPSPPATGEEA